MPTSERRNSCCSGKTTTTSTSSSWKMVGTWTDRLMEQQTRPYGCVGNSGTIGDLASPWEISYFSREILMNIDEPVDLGAGCRLAYWQIHHETRCRWNWSRSHSQRYQKIRSGPLPQRFQKLHHLIGSSRRWDWARNWLHLSLFSSESLSKMLKLWFSSLGFKSSGFERVQTSNPQQCCSCSPALASVSVSDQLFTSSMWNNELLTTVQTKYLEWLVHHSQMLHHFFHPFCATMW